MSKNTVLDEVIKKIQNQGLNKSEALKSLVHFIENDEDVKLRLRALESFCKYSNANSETYSFLENLAMSDESEKVRIISLKNIVIMFPDASFKPIQWLVQNETNLQILGLILNILNSDADNTEYATLKRNLFDRYKTFFNVVEDEVEFLLELMIQLSKLWELELDEKFIEEISTSHTLGFKYWTDPYLLAIRNGHLRKINLLCLEIERLPESIKHCSRLRYLDLSRTKLTAIPDSIGSLCYLRELNLSACHLTDLPDSLSKLKSLKYLHLGDNFSLNHIPESLAILCRETRYKKYLNDGVRSDEAQVLALLDSFNGYKLEKIPDHESEVRDFYDFPIDFPYFDSPEGPLSHYKINEDGYITAIYYTNPGGDPTECKLSVFPEQLCNLEHLEELSLGWNAIKILPEGIGKLKSLNKLNLLGNPIKKLPKSIGKLKNLELLLL